MSLAGAQHKMVVVLRDGELFEPLPGTPSTHILKPNRPAAEYPASVIDETLTMRLAHRLGLAVPSVALRYVPEPVYIVERFDRELPALRQSATTSSMPASSSTRPAASNTPPQPWIPLPQSSPNAAPGPPPACGSSAGCCSTHWSATATTT